MTFVKHKNYSVSKITRRLAILSYRVLTPLGLNFIMNVFPVDLSEIMFIKVRIY
jgi:hypothetical protein